MAPPGPRLSFHAHSGQHQIITSVHSDHEVVVVEEVLLKLLQLSQHDHHAYLGYHIYALQFGGVLYRGGEVENYDQQHWVDGSYILLW